jgi:SAM-dependent methyltransferase
MPEDDHSRMDVPVPAANSAYIVEDQQRMSRARNYFAWQARVILPELGRRVLEIGCGIGNFTELLAGREAVIAIDAEPDCVTLVKSRCPRVEAFAMDASSESFQDLARFKPDSCVILNVLEHIDDDAGTLQRIASILPSRGRIVLLAPAFPALYGPIDHHLGHYRRYSRAGIRDLARSAGLEIRKLRYMNAVRRHSANPCS